MTIIHDDPKIPFRMLHTLPSFIDKSKLEIGRETRIYEIQNMHEYEHFCIMHTDTMTKMNGSKRFDEDKWSGTETWKEFLELLEKGDERVIEKLQNETKKAVSQMQKEYREVLTSYKFDVTGEFFDIGLVLLGVPETWLQPVFDIEEKNKVDLLLNGTYSARVDPDTVIKNAARVMSITKILEDHDIQVSIKIVAIDDMNCGRRTNIQIFKLKNYDEPINYKKVSLALSPAFFRRGVFRIWEVVYGDDITYGYSYPNKKMGFIRLDERHGKSINELEILLFKKESK